MSERRYWYSATVERAVDGDTLDLTIDHGCSIFSRQRIRLYGVDTPEIYGPKACPRGKEAWDYVKSNCEGREVMVHTVKDRTGKYGRLLAIIFFKTGETWHNLNQQLVELDMAFPDENYVKAVSKQVK